MQVNSAFVFQVFVIPCVSGGMPVDQLVNHPLRFWADGGATRNQEPSACLPEWNAEIEQEPSPVQTQRHETDRCVPRSPREHVDVLCLTLQRGGWHWLAPLCKELARRFPVRDIAFCCEPSHHAMGKTRETSQSQHLTVKVWPHLSPSIWQQLTLH